jgi:Acetyltransferase (GNAT) domain
VKKPAQAQRVHRPWPAVDVLSLAEAKRCGRWQRMLASQRKDRRYYEVLEATMRQDFDFHYFAIRDGSGEVRAIVPLFVTDLDLLAGLPQRIQRLTAFVRRLFPRFMRVRTLMVGCAAGKGHLDDADELSWLDQAKSLSRTIAAHGAELRTPLIVFKEFPSTYRSDLACLLQAGFTRVPSLPMASLGIDYPTFEAFMSRALSSGTRKNLHAKFRRAEAAGPIELTVVPDITPVIDDVYPLYLQVYERAHLRFEQLTREYLCRLGREMPDKTRFFIWRLQGRIVAFGLCMVQNDDIFGEYLGIDYAVAFDLHLYHLVYRDVISWAMAHGYKTFRSGEGGYDAKLHLRFRLDPVDLYVRHASGFMNVVLSRLLRYLVPVSYDPLLRQFPNFDQMWGD